MRRILAIAPIVAALLAAGAVLPRAGTSAATAQAETAVLGADADAYVASGSARRLNFGDEPDIRVGGMFPGDQATTYRALVRFDAVTQTLPADAVVDEATLRLEHLGSAGSLVVLARRAVAAWDEATVTWETQPGSAVPEASRAVGGGAGIYQWDVTAHVADWAARTHANHGLVLVAEDESVNAVKPFRSREGVDPPGRGTPAPPPAITLEIVWHLPEPTATSSATPTRPTRTAPATRTPTPTPTVDPPTRTPTLDLPSRTATDLPTRTEMPSATITEEPSATATELDRPTRTPDITASPTPPDSVVFDDGCGGASPIGARRTVRVRSSAAGTLVVTRWPGPLALGQAVVAPGDQITFTYLVAGPLGPQRITAELVDAEGVSASCDFRVEPPSVPTATATGSTPPFMTPTPPPTSVGQVFLPFAARTGGVPPGPGDITAGDTHLAREVDISYVRELPQPAQLVAAVGGGASHRLLGWELSGLSEPELVGAGPVRPGVDVRVLGLDPAGYVAPGAGPLVVSAARHAGGLWLATWRLDEAGGFELLDTLGFGTGDVDVQGYALAARPRVQDGVLEAWLVLTPVRNGAETLRVASWSVDPASGAITGRDDTGDWYTAASGSPLDAAYLPRAKVELDPASGFQGGESYDIDRLFAVTFRTREGKLGIWLVTLGDNGAVGWFGGGESGVTLRGTSTLAYDADDSRVAALTRTGLLTAVVNGGDAPEPIVWDYRAVTGANGLVPHRVSRATWDKAPDAKGIVLAEDNPADPAFVDAAVDGERAIVTDLLWEDLGEGDGSLFGKLPAAPGPAGNLGSVAKLMAYYLVLEAIQEGILALDDVIEVPEEGTETGPSWMTPPLAGGDRVRVETLLHGLMKPSSNGAARTLGWYVAGLRYGMDLDYQTRFDLFLGDMNAAAAELGLADSLYCNIAGGSHSSPQDQVTLWRAASEVPLFWRFTGVGTYDPPCDEDADGNPKCFAPMAKGNLGFPGLDGEKNGLQGKTNVGYTGGGALSCEAYPNGTTVDACRQCRVGQLTRLGRSFAAEATQSDDSAGDLVTLFAYGLLRQFTPDRRALALEANPVVLNEEAVALALASRTHLPLASAVVTADGSLRVCTFGANGGIGQLAQLACTEPDVPGLGPAGDFRPGPRPALAEADALAESEGDYVTMYRDGAMTRLSLWRVAPREPTW